MKWIYGQKNGVPIKCETKKKRNETKPTKAKQKSTKTKRNRLIRRKWKEKNKRQICKFKKKI
jgi:hypothetical protein